jgi:hypothetical protein
MELEPHQYGVLKTYQKWRHHPPTYGSLIRANLKPFAVMTLYCAAAAFGCYFLHITAFILLFVGFWLGQLVAESARIRTIPVAWSELARVLDWTRVEKAIASRRFD